jgi:acyl-coenzyme A synthetase/AMP-(fatty) acid ligase
VRYLAEIGTIIPWRTTADDRQLITSPFFWVGGFLSLGGVMNAGATVVCSDEHAPDILLEVIRSERVTQTTALSRSLMSCRDFRPEDLDQLRPQSLGQRSFFNRAEHGPPECWSNSLGMTETFGPHSGDPSAGLLASSPPGSFGRSLSGYGFKIVDPVTREELAPGEAGELCIRGPWVMEGFYKRDRTEVFDADGYYPTGDKCLIDAEGRLYFQGRLGGMIKTSGANVSPEEVEIALRSCDQVLDAAVFGLPDKNLGQMVTAVVVPAPGALPDEAGLKLQLRKYLSSFKIPKRILFMNSDQLPLTPSNKIRKSALADMVAAVLSATG